MLRLFKALIRSLLDLFHPKMLLLLLVPPVLSLIVWGGLGFVFWDSLLTISQSIGEKFLFTQSIPPWMMEWFAVTPTSVATALAAVIAVLLILPMAVLTSMLITSVVAMPVVLAYVGKSFPGLEKRGSSVLVGSFKNLFKSSLIYLLLWLISLPFWMIPGLGVALPLLLNGYLNYRLFAYDALGDFASPRELKVLLNRKRVDFLLLGVITSALLLLPPLFLILPIYSALCFARYSLLELHDLRLKA
jgi:hypothetical protein